MKKTIKDGRRMEDKKEGCNRGGRVATMLLEVRRNQKRAEVRKEKKNRVRKEVGRKRQKEGR